MRIEDHPTPRTDRLEITMDERDTQPLDKLPQYAVHARDLERRLQAIHAIVEGDADGTIDATPYEKLCNEIAGLTGITI